VRSLRAGGCTFAEDPGQSCASLLPLWSAAIDPHVLSVRASVPNRGENRLFDANTLETRLVRGPEGEHLAIVCEDIVVRLDVIDGTVASGPVSIRFEVADDWRLRHQLAAIGALRDPPRAGHRHLASARKLAALYALDLRNEGASLRRAAETLLGPGDWPGDGEHRKSTIRRFIATGERMVRAGPGEILRSR